MPDLAAVSVFISAVSALVTVLTFIRIIRQDLVMARQTSMARMVRKEMRRQRQQTTAVKKEVQGVAEVVNSGHEVMKARLLELENAAAVLAASTKAKAELETAAALLATAAKAKAEQDAG